MTKQDIIHALLIFGLVGMNIENKLSTFLSPKAFALVDVGFLAAILLAYYADQIFIKKQEIPIPTPQ